MNQPLVTIGLPTYNRPDGLQKVLASIKNQTYTNLEIIISDNCSTNERVQQIIREFTATDSRAQSIRQSVNIGLENNFNFVFEKSTANYFIWMSDDDHFDANYIEECISFLEKNPKHMLCSGIAKYYTGDTFLFTEKMFTVDNENPAKRLFRLFNNIAKNGNFYGVFRNRLLLEKPIGEHIGCDWSLMAKFSIIGKLGYVTSTNYHRSADGNSETKRKMINKFGFNKLQSLFFETTIAYIISTNIFNDTTVSNKFGYFKKKIIVTIIFLQINYRAVLQFAYKLMGKNFFRA
jgi:glycosyltransferase involved in cell wall biosynthesis